MQTITSQGKNAFENNEFSAEEWSASCIASPAEIKSLIQSFHLSGRKITGIKMIGLCYDKRRIWIEDEACRTLHDLPEEERWMHSEYRNIDRNLKFSRFCEIDEPLLIRFEDGDIFEIDTPEEPYFCMSMNCIPWDIKAGTNLPNIDGNALFAPCIGQIINRVEIVTYESDRHPMYSFPFEDHAIREMVANILLHLDNGMALSISGFIDFCHVECIGADGETATIPFKELKHGLYNWEDIHDDESVGLVGNDADLYFGRIGARWVSTPSISLNPSGKDTSLHVYAMDFQLFDWSITVMLHDFHDEYADYTFSYTQWQQILSEAKRLVSFNTFDDLFDYLHGLDTDSKNGKNMFMRRLNSSGKEFWKDRDKNKRKLDIVQKWTELTMTPSDTMWIQGFLGESK